MNRISIVPFAAALACSVALAPHAACAAGAAARAWVSAAKGTDTPGCGAVNAPCRSLQYALDNAAASGGSILVLDPGGYGSITIANPISIINDGVGTAGIFSANSTGNAIDINLPAGGQVLPKGLTINGAATGMNGNGVDMKSAGIFTMANCTVTGFTGFSATGNGVIIRPTSGTANVHISDGAFSGNGSVGVFVAPNYPANGAASAAGAIRNAAMNNNFYGFYGFGGSTSGTVKTTIEDSVAS